MYAVHPFLMDVPLHVATVVQQHLEAAKWAKHVGDLAGAKAALRCGERELITAMSNLDQSGTNRYLFIVYEQAAHALSQARKGLTSSGEDEANNLLQPLLALSA